MSTSRLYRLTAPVRALLAPHQAMAESEAAAGWGALGLLLGVTALGALALPRLLHLLGGAMPPTGNPIVDAQNAVVTRALMRLVVVDRLVPPLDLVLGACLLCLIAALLFWAAGESPRRVVGAVALASAPALIQRLGELAVVWLVGRDGMVAGEVISLPARFNTGLTAVLTAFGRPPGGWMEVGASALSVVGVWTIALWALALRRSDARSAAGAQSWALGAACLAYAGGVVAVGFLRPALVPLVLGSP